MHKNVKYMYLSNISPKTRLLIFGFCVQAEMEMETVLMARKQLLQQWNSSLVGMRKRDEAFSVMQKTLW